jgi:pectate lyase
VIDLSGAVSHTAVPTAGPASQPDAGRYLQAVRVFADNALRYGRDTYGAEHTPLFVDGLNVDTHEPAVWQLDAEHAASWNMPREWVLSNLATQQNFFRVLTSLSLLTGETRYKQAAVDATRYAFDHLAHPCGLLYWGGHAAWDLRTHQPVGEGRSAKGAGKHELKRHYPYYELMWEVDPKFTRRFIEAVWSNHVLSFENLDFNRHGPWAAFDEHVWDHTYVGGPVPFIGVGLTFSNSGSDLFYAAAMLHHFTGDPRPLQWSKRLAKMYVDARHPKTGLGADNFSEERTRRFVQQFGAEFGERLTEATFTSIYGTRYEEMAICQLKLAERLGPAGEEFRRWAVEDLTAYARHCYDPSDNSFRATLIDGTPLSPADRKREGYVMERWLSKRPASELHLWAYGLAFGATRDPLMWDMVRQIAAGLGLGEFGRTPGRFEQVNMSTTADQGDLIFALIDLHRATGDPRLPGLASVIADNLLAREFHHGFFVPDRRHLMAQLDHVGPLALLYLYAARERPSLPLPGYSASRGYLHCDFESQGRTYDHRAIYARLRPE